jgi:hypothetical protein
VFLNLAGLGRLGHQAGLCSQRLLVVVLGNVILAQVGDITEGSSLASIDTGRGNRGRLGAG